ncbi:MAG: hypothetical protein J0M05_11780 [Candidatus Kapabacteria bacterium]|nr:hypothetical protein [Candidatus Kapabacteria bacterium]
MTLGNSKKAHSHYASGKT